MLRSSMLVLVTITLVVIIALAGFYVYEQYGTVEWNQWVARVCVVSQPGSTGSVVRQVLGQPDSIEGPEDIGRGFLPKPKIGVDVTEVYVYKEVFPSAGGLWVAYIFINRDGNVLGSHIAFS